jgi:small subunit ribosomal protein S1
MSDRELSETKAEQAATPESPDFEAEFGTDEEQDALMEAYLSTMKKTREGEVRMAKILSIGEESALVNLDDKAEGVVPIAEFTNPDGKITVKVGDEVPVQIVQRDPDEGGQIIASHKDAKRLMALQNLAEAFDKSTVLKGTISQVIKGGMLVDCGIDCFMPASHLDIKRIDKLEDWIGAEIEFGVLELNQRANRAVVSRRKVLEDRREKRLDELLSTLKEGDVVSGIAATVLHFGAFIDLEGAEGFIPREEMSWEKTASPVDCVRPGNQVEAKVKKLDREARKITLSRRAMTPDPWQAAPAKYPKGAIVDGEVTGLTNFGAFVRVEEGVTGLVHAGDMSWSSQSTRPADMLNEGDRVKVAVLDIDTKRQRLSLGLKQLTEDPWTEAESQFPKNTKIKGTVSGVARFGLFVRLTDEIEGLIHQNDLSWDKKPPAPASIAKEGDEIEALVLKTDRASRRLSLGIKQMTPSPMESFAKQHRAGGSVEGTIVNVIDSGAFLELAPGIEGFLHVSQIRESEERIQRAGDELKVGEQLTVKITKIDKKQNRISLSRKAHVYAEERASMKEYLKDGKDESRGGMNLGELLQDITLPGDE